MAGITTLLPNSDEFIGGAWTRYTGTGNWYDSINDESLSDNGIYLYANTLGTTYTSLLFGYENLASIPDDEYVHKITFYTTVSTQAGWGNGVPIGLYLLAADAGVIIPGALDGWDDAPGYPVSTDDLEIFWEAGNYYGWVTRSTHRIFDESQSPSLTNMNKLQLLASGGPGFSSVHNQFTAIHQARVDVETRPRRNQKVVI